MNALSNISQDVKTASFTYLKMRNQQFNSEDFYSY